MSYCYAIIIIIRDQKKEKATHEMISKKISNQISENAKRRAEVFEKESGMVLICVIFLSN